MINLIIYFLIKSNKKYQNKYENIIKLINYKFV
jgi:hypothetical protein